MKSAVTICLVQEARQGPFVYHQGLSDGCARASKLGFHGVEIFPPAASAVNPSDLKTLLRKHRLKVAAIGTGAGWLRKQWSLTAPDSSIRRKAIQFISQMIDLAGQFSAPVIVGSMQGRIQPEVERGQALDWLAESLRKLSLRAADSGQVLLYEPLNRYETNLMNRIDLAALWLDEQSLEHVRVLADLFHANIEEADVAAAIGRCGTRLGHVHFADSNRQAVGQGHTRMTPIIKALRKVGYDGYLSAEIFPLPTSDQASEQTMKSFRKLIPKRKSIDA